MLKALLASLAVMVLVDAAAWNSHYCREAALACKELVTELFGDDLDITVAGGAAA